MAEVEKEKTVEVEKTVNPEEVTTEVTATTEPVEETPKGRKAFLAMINKDEPDYVPTDDEELFERANGLSSELGRHKESSGKMASIIAKDPRIGAVLGMVAEGKSYPYAHAKVFGKEAMDLEGQELEDWEQGYQENLEQMGVSEQAQAEAQKNIETYIGNLDTYMEGRPEEEKAALNDIIYQMADNMLMGVIPMEVIELVDKGMNRDQDVQDAADTAAAETRNVKIDMKKKTVENTPDMGTATKTSPTPKQAPKERKSFYDNLEE